MRIMVLVQGHSRPDCISFTPLKDGQVWAGTAVRAHPLTQNADAERKARGIEHTQLSGQCICSLVLMSQKEKIKDNCKFSKEHKKTHPLLTSP